MSRTSYLATLCQTRYQSIACELYHSQVATHIKPKCSEWRTVELVAAQVSFVRA